MFPIHLDLGFRRFYFYEGLYFLIAIVVAYLWAAKRIRRYGLSEDQFWRALIGALIGMLIGARLFHFIFWQPSLLVSRPLVFFNYWDGGLSITGGLAGGIGGASLAFIKRKERFLEYFAVLSPAVLLGQAIGRIGCFMNGDAWGIPTSLPWGLRFPKFGRILPSGAVDRSIPGFAWSWAYDRGLVGPADSRTPPLHPTQLYESLGDLLILAVVLLAFRRLGKAGGRFILALQVGCYCLLRFFLEYLRGDREATVLLGMSSMQIALAAVALACLPIALICRGR
jgi:phosphatidylglycerol---prolipoprotein diacylglyceryl transferase